MKVESILRSKGTDVVTTRPDSTIATVVDTFKRQGVGALVVTEDGSHVLGLIDERDIISGLAEHGARLLHLAVADLMHGGIAMCAPDDSLEHVMARMTHRRVRHIPVARDRGAVRPRQHRRCGQEPAPRPSVGDQRPARCVQGDPEQTHVTGVARPTSRSCRWSPI